MSYDHERCTILIDAGSVSDSGHSQLEGLQLLDGPGERLVLQCVWGIPDGKKRQF